ncbi:MAG: HAD hydrolase-like protein [Candidatus Moranbacteria bacterium]|nr:HAD hydrolase-like protein [Candidatus Moranbacteria bacterium]
MLKKHLVKAVGFDLDQTFYQDTQATKKAYRDTLYHLLAKNLKISVKKAQQQFEKHYQILGSGTEAVRLLGINEPEKFSARVSNQAKQHLYLKKDPELVNLIQYLKDKYLTFLVTASGEIGARLKLKKLGLSADHDFQVSVFGDSAKASKTKGLSFSHVLKQTKLDPPAHVYVGDRDATDILPAKRQGMQTVLVWGKSKQADLSLPEIYQLDQYL